MSLVPFFGTTPPQNPQPHPLPQFHPKDFQSINRAAADICGKGLVKLEDYIIALAAGVGDRAYIDIHTKTPIDPVAGDPFMTLSAQEKLSGGRNKDLIDLPSGSVISRFLTLTSAFGYGPHHTPSLETCYSHLEKNHSKTPFLYVSYPEEWKITLPAKPQLESAFELRDIITEAAKKYNGNRPDTACNLALAALAEGIRETQGLLPPRQAMRAAVQTIVSVAQLCPLTIKNKHSAEQRLAQIAKKNAAIPA